jgi:hypothetical protein
MDQREKALIKKHNRGGLHGLNSTMGGQGEALATKYNRQKRKASLIKFTNEYMPTFRKIKDKGLDVNVPQDMAHHDGSGPAEYEAVFGSYDDPVYVKRARSYVILCMNIRAGITDVPPSFGQERSNWVSRYAFR